MLTRDSRPHRLVVRTSRCGRDNPGSTPGVVMQVHCRGTRQLTRVPADRLRCLWVVTDVHSRLERKLQMQRPAWAQMALIACQMDLGVFDLPDPLDTRFSLSRINMHVGARIKTTSSSGQDVVLWPRQPRFKSWCGHRAMALLADMLM